MSPLLNPTVFVLLAFGVALFFLMLLVVDTVFRKIRAADAEANSLAALRNDHAAEASSSSSDPPVPGPEVEASDAESAPIFPDDRDGR